MEPVYVWIVHEPCQSSSGRLTFLGFASFWSSISHLFFFLFISLLKSVWSDQFLRILCSGSKCAACELSTLSTRCHLQSFQFSYVSRFSLLLSKTKIGTWNTGWPLFMCIPWVILSLIIMAFRGLPMGALPVMGETPWHFHLVPSHLSMPRDWKEQVSLFSGDEHMIRSVSHCYRYCSDAQF